MGARASPAAKRWRYGDPRRAVDTLRELVVLVALVCAGCASAVPVDRLRATTLAVDSLGSVYLLDASGEQATRVLDRKQTRDGPGQWGPLYDEYFQPSLSPDGRHVACVRLHNSSHRGSPAELVAIQSSEVIIVRVGDGAERVVMSVASEVGRGRAVLSPVWSIGGDRIFFAVDRRVWSYSVAGARLDPVVDLASHYVGSFGSDDLRGTYLRVSGDGTRLFGLLRTRIGRTGLDDAVVEIDLTSGTFRPLWSGNLSSGSVFEIDRPLPAAIDDEGVQALFGSREFPVFAPKHSADRRFYFFVKHEMGWLGRIWVSGYDRQTRRDFEVRTMWRTLFWK
jgi:hypothetical protein